jgi:hypothetical protein
MLTPLSILCHYKRTLKIRLIYKEKRLISHISGGWKDQDQGTGIWWTPSWFLFTWQTAEKQGRKFTPIRPFHCSINPLLKVKPSDGNTSQSPTSQHYRSGNYVSNTWIWGGGTNSDHSNLEEKYVFHVLIEENPILFIS